MKDLETDQSLKHETSIHSSIVVSGAKPKIKKVNNFTIPVKDRKQVVPNEDVKINQTQQVEPFDEYKRLSLKKSPEWGQLAFEHEDEEESEIDLLKCEEEVVDVNI